MKRMASYYDEQMKPNLTTQDLAVITNVLELRFNNLENRIETAVGTTCGPDEWDMKEYRSVARVLQRVTGNMTKYSQKDF